MKKTTFMLFLIILLVTLAVSYKTNYERKLLEDKSEANNKSKIVDEFTKPGEKGFPDVILWAIVGVAILIILFIAIIFLRKY